MSDIRYMSKKFITEFIELYKSLPSLWNLKYKGYYNRAQKNADYEIMVKKLREIEPDATRAMITKKINSFRSSRRKEMAKIQESIDNGGEVYVPKLWYFKLMDFVDGQETITEAALRERGQNSGNSQNDDDHSATMVSHRRQSNSSNQASSDDDAAAFDTPSSKTNKQTIMRKRKLSHEGTIETKDTHEDFGRYVARKLSNLPHKQRIFTEKIINDAIFEAELGNLNRDCYVYVPARRIKTSDSE